MLTDITETGIPQSAANPLAAELERPALEREAENARAMRDWRARSLRNIDSAVLDWETFSRDKPVDLRFDPDPEAARKRGIVHSYLRLANDGQPIGGGDLGPQLMRDRIATERFAGRGVGDDLAFFSEIEKESLGRKADKDLGEALMGEAARSALVTAVEGPARAGAFGDWLAEAKKAPGYRPGMDFAYLEEWNAQQSEVADSIADFGEPLAEVWKAMKQGGAGSFSEVAKALAKDAFLGFEGQTQEELAKKDAGAIASEVFDSLSDEDRVRFMDSIGRLARTLPKDEQPAFWANMNKGGGRMVDDIARNIGSRFTHAAMEEHLSRGVGRSRGPLAPSEGERAEARAHAESLRQRRIGRLNFADEVRRIEREDYAPIRHFSGGSDDFWSMRTVEEGVYGIPGVAASVGTVMIPYAGAPAMFLAMEGFAYGDLRDNMVAAGASMADASDAADRWKTELAIPQTMIDRIQALGIARKLPAVNKALDALGDKITNRILRGMAVSGAVGVAETAAEEGQHLMTFAMQDIIAALEQDTGVPAAVWSNGENGAFDGFWQRQGSMFISMAPMAIFSGAGGLNREARARAFAEASPLQRRAFGITPEHSAAIDEAASRGQSSLNSAIDAALAGRVPESEQARAAVAELEAEIASIQAAQEELKESRMIPDMIREADGTWIVRDQETGTEVGRAQDPAGAFRLAKAHSSALSESAADRIGMDARELMAEEQAEWRRDVLATTMEAAELAAKQLGGEGSATSIELGNRMTTDRLTGRDAARAAEQILLEDRAEGGDGSVIRAVWGRSVTELHEDVRKTINRVFEGGSILTVFHEKGHEMRRRAIESGAMTRDMQVSMFRALDTVLAGKTRRGQELRFIPESVADANITETMLDEAFSTLLESEVIRSGRDSKSKVRVPRGIISRNIAALAKLMGPEASQKWGSFMKAVRHYWGLAFSRAKALDKGLREGTISREQYDDFMSRMLGLDQQDGFNIAALETREEILGDYRMEEDDPFAIAPGTDLGTAQGRVWEGEGYAIDLLTPTSYAGGMRGMQLALTAGGQKVGWLKLIEYPDRPGWLEVDLSNIERSHRNKGLGNQLYRQALRTMPEEMKGLSSDLSLRLNNREVPAIWRRFGGYQENGFAFMPRENVIEEMAAFSLGPAAMADALRGEAIDRIRDPRQRMEVFRRVAEKMEDLKRDKDQLGVAFGKGYRRKAIQDPRDRASIAREARVREALRRAELEDQAYARHSEILSDPDLVKLRQQPVHAMLADPDNPLKGRVMSKSAAIRAQWFDESRHGDFDGSDGVSRSVFGGARMPDQAAQELHDAGLIKAPTPAAMWDALRQEAATVATMKDFLKAAQADLKAARETAKKEAKAWRKTRLLEERANYSPKARLLRAMALMEGIVAALPIAERGRIGGYTQIARLESDEKRLEFLMGRIAKADEVVENWLKREYDKLLNRVLERAKPSRRKVGEKPKGTAGADIHALFDVLRDARGWTVEKAEAHAVALEAEIAKGEMTPEAEAHATIQANLVRLIGNWKDADAARRASAVENISRTLDAGYAQFQMAKLIQRRDREASRRALIAHTGKLGTRQEREAKMLDDNKLKGRWKDVTLGLLNFEQALGFVFGDGSSQARRLTDMERTAAYQKEDAVQAKVDAVEDLYTKLAGSRYKGEVLRWEMAQKSIEVKGESFSELEAITATLMWRQEDGRRHMIGHKDGNGNPAGPWHYDQAFVDALEAALSAEALAVRDHLVENYTGEWATLNPIFRELNGIDLPKNPNYSPLTVKPAQAQGGQSIDPVTGSTMSGGSTTPGSLRTRGQSIAEPQFRDALQTYLGHTKQMEHWKAYAGFAAEAQSLLNNREVGNAVSAKAGEQAVSVLRGWLDLFAQGGTRDASAHLEMNKMLNRMTGRAASVALVGRIGTLAIQSTQLGAALAEMPTASYLKRLGLLMSGNMNWKTALDSPYIQRRLKEMPPVVRQAVEGLRASEPNRVKHAAARLGTLLSGADALFTAGTFAMVHDYQLGQAKRMGLTGPAAEAHALQAAERATDRIAQPTRPGTRSLFENTATNPLVRLTWNFASEARKNLGLLAYATVKKPLAEKMRVLTYVWVINGVMAAMIRTAWRDARDDEDDELFDEKHWDLKRMSLQVLTEPIYGVPVLGSMIEAGVFKAAGEYIPQGNLFSMMDNAVVAAMRLDETLTGEADAAQVLKDVEALLSGVGLLNDTVAATASLSHLARDLFGVAENILDD